MYILTQLAKMLFLATFFPMSELEEEEGVHKFDFFNDFLRVLHLEALQFAGQHSLTGHSRHGRPCGDLPGHVQSVWQGLCQSSNRWSRMGFCWTDPYKVGDFESLREIIRIPRLVFLWVGARGVEFDWRCKTKS